MIIYKMWGQHLRLGNWLFNYMSLLNICKRTGQQMKLPEYFAWKYMLHPPEIDPGTQEHDTFHFRTLLWSREEQDWLYEHFGKNHEKIWNINLGSNNQSELWFQDELEYIKEMARFTPEAISRVKEKYTHMFTKPTIGIGIRRGDFVGHGVFYQIPEDWYEKALAAHFPDHENCNIVVFSDDIEWCKVYYQGKNWLYAEPNNTHTHAENFKHYHKDPMEQFILGILMDNMIIGNSTFSWWQAWYVDHFNKGKIVHSGKNLSDAGNREFGHNIYFYPDRWILHNIE